MKNRFFNSVLKLTTWRQFIPKLLNFSNPSTLLTKSFGFNANDVTKSNEATEKEREIDLSRAIVCVGWTRHLSRFMQRDCKYQLIKTSQPYQFTETRIWRMITTHTVLSITACVICKSLKGRDALALIEDFIVPAQAVNKAINQLMSIWCDLVFFG